jgi:ubiquinone/menaquinone biosynthesis C-methylase UbiE
MAMTVNTTYEPYAKEPEYVETNRAFLATLDLNPVTRVGDLACGTGLLSELLLERKPSLHICGIEISAEQLDIARREFSARGLSADGLEAFREDRGDRGVVAFHHASADSLPFEDGELDLVVMGSAIHLMPDRDRFVDEVARVLRPGGRFAFNTVFFVGTFVPGTEPIYTEWLKEAVLVLEEKNRALEEAGLPKVKRVRGRVGRAFSRRWLTPEGWCDVLRRHGFTAVEHRLREAQISQRGLELVGAYGGLAEVLMSGYPVEVASECLQRAVGRAFDSLAINQIPRNWLEVTAEAP